MQQSIRPESNAGGGTDAHLVLLPSFLADLPQRRLGEYITLYTARRSYFGRLVEINRFFAVLEAASDNLDCLVHLRINLERIEAVELLRD